LTLLGEVDLSRLADVFPEIGRVIEDNLIKSLEDADESDEADVDIQATYADVC
jgi:hypothetical protein